MKQKTKTFTIYVFAIAIALASGCTSSELKLPSIISDGMVLQCNADVTIWGEAVSGTKIKVTTSWGVNQTAEARFNRTWDVKIPAGEAGGPYEITIDAGDTVCVIKDVYVGEVWMASGQSNMEMPVSGWLPNDTIYQSMQTIAQANLPLIRMYTVPKNICTEPADNAQARWKVCSPQTVSEFSATAFYFARKLNVELETPIGIIHSSWGGTNAESWISAQSLSRMEKFRTVIENISNAKAQSDIYNMWLQQFEAVDVAPVEGNLDPIIGIDIFDSLYSHPNFIVDNSIATITLPCAIETATGTFDGAVWYFKTVEIPSSWEDKELMLSLGAIDDRDVTWFDGKKIGATEENNKWNVNRLYTIPANDVHQGKSTIAVRVIDTQGGGGLLGNGELMKIYPAGNPNTAISLAGEWNYTIAAELIDNKFYKFNPAGNDFSFHPQKAMNLNANTPSALYNGMVSPVVKYTVKGVIWYQGEANVGRSHQYLELMRTLIADWRTRFNSELPFYFVQIAPYSYGNPDAEASAWIREAQRRTLEVENTGMAVTLDIGNVNNIHPANKKDVGERLAFWALANDYHKEVPFSGPIYNGKFEISENTITVEFTYADGLQISGSAPNQFEIAGTNGVYHPAAAMVDGNSVVLSSKLVPHPQNARYAFKNGSEASLFNAAGLPASTFTTEKELRD
ncbi:MAG: hypothetical protein LBV41_11795 [Cytophagaceae bacterium]|jgi:sialate O-acetylesterase|nr:hypothetical protein [Cytophagaceae bacterium]